MVYAAGIVSDDLTSLFMNSEAIKNFDTLIKKLLQLFLDDDSFVEFLSKYLLDSAFCGNFDDLKSRDQPLY